MGYRCVGHHCNDDRNATTGLTTTEAHKEAKRLSLIRVSAVNWETEV